eukprot:scaffold27876_cov51-Attheya_sp.AAC.1
METYEATRAYRSTERLPDKISWSASESFRSNPYRQLHHQEGLMGTLQVRLVEASGLKRSHWSALALGPMKHLGLSRAHGAVSSHATFRLAFRDPTRRQHDRVQNSPPFHHNSSSPLSTPGMLTPNRPGFARDVEDDMSACSEGGGVEEDDASVATVYPTGHEVYRSSVVRDNSDPVWTASDKSQFPVLLRKGGMPHDGMRILLEVRMDEERTAAEAFLPQFSGGASHHPPGDQQIIGTGFIDVTNLCLGEDAAGERVSTGFMDVWINLTLQSKDQHTSNSSVASLSGQSKNSAASSSVGGSSSMGSVRILVSYEPHGLVPRPNDVCALEAFARRSLRLASCRPILPPLQPLRVLDVRGSYLLVEYNIPSTSSSSQQGNNSSKNGKAESVKKGRVRIHRNAVFVVERTNVVDKSINLALAPADILLATPLGRATTDFAGPYAEAVGDMLMPVLLSGKLLFSAAKTGAHASINAVGAATQTVAAAQDPRNRNRSTRYAHQGSRNTNDNNNSYQEYSFEERYSV